MTINTGKVVWSDDGGSWDGSDTWRQGTSGDPDSQI